MSGLERSSIFTEQELPDAADLLTEGMRLAESMAIGTCPFLTDHGVSSEAAYKHGRITNGDLMFHAQFGFRNFDKSRRAYAEIYEKVAEAGYRVDRYGICLDWSMGYPPAQRHERPRGTGLILEGPDDFKHLTQAAVGHRG